MACSVSTAAHRSQSAPVESSSSGVVAAATTTSIMLTSSGGTGSPGASTTPLHARPATSTAVDHPLPDPGGHWRPGGGDSAKRKAPDRCSSNEVSAKRSGGQSRRSALSGRPVIACQSDPGVIRSVGSLTSDSVFGVMVFSPSVGRRRDLVNELAWDVRLVVLERRGRRCCLWPGGWVVLAWVTRLGRSFGGRWLA